MVPGMALKAVRLPDRCEQSRLYTSAHWHHVCWNCGAGVCGAGSFGGGDCYSCPCGCSETSNMTIKTDKDYDAELAATSSCPA
jgi:hypothetical protein